MTNNIVSFFAGAGGLDLGFEQAGFNVTWANEYDKDIWDTYKKNHPHTYLEQRSITEINAKEVPECDGIIGGPPCQSWSEAGTQRGIEDKRGQLFFDFIRILQEKKPKFFLAENVSGMQHSRHAEALNNIKKMFKEAGYDLFYQMMNAVDYGAAQDRKRVIFIGFRSDLKIEYSFPKPIEKQDRLNLKDIILDLDGSAVPALDKQKPNPAKTILNHEYMIGGFSTMFMSRNRVRTWDEPSFTIQAGGRHAPIHPGAPKMEKVGNDKFKFIDGYEDKYRRLSVRECARIQGFPDDFEFIYKNVATGYKMIGNAVAVPFAKAIALSIKAHLSGKY
ncbi:DNA (cytosine-5-)-methyltransferase [Aliivibrio fischeri]|uniref:DNA cytosine methyltransferase n=1 Tax=Aliivibrio fischeri TaxID=668 RepID=UPI0012DA5F2E|nr:DNA cytosine methyltransferase [Aliivibrio fischeri]MUL04955.1 DNA (cytosine-5-)-methyltransferase [Aliivibrio fischeri]